MATFEVQSTEYTRWLKVSLENDSVRTERGALNRMVGSIVMDVPWPSLRAVWVSLFSDESLLRPRFRGTGSVFLDSTLGGFHLFTVKPEEKWILDTRSFWASDGEVDLAIYREWLLTALWAGEGFLWYKTALRGQGQVALAVNGPVEEVVLDHGKLVVDGPFVVARTSGISLRLQRPTRSLLSYWMSGQERSWVYEGTGRLFICPVPYWRRRMQLENVDPAVAAGV
jgi:uncharacterized protein (AIM24 family)